MSRGSVKGPARVVKLLEDADQIQVIQFSWNITKD